MKSFRTVLCNCHQWLSLGMVGKYQKYLGCCFQAFVSHLRSEPHSQGGEVCGAETAHAVWNTSQGEVHPHCSDQNRASWCLLFSVFSTQPEVLKLYQLGK